MLPVPLMPPSISLTLDIQLKLFMPHAFERVDEAVSGEKPPAGKRVGSLLSWQG